MRLWTLCFALLSLGCSSENGLYHKPKGGRPDKEESPPEPGSATLKGRVCAFDGDTAVTHAIVTVSTDDGELSDETDGEGDFVIEGLPPGTWPVLVKKGSFEVFFEVTLEANEVTELDVDECVPLEQGNVEIAVVTGAYDDIGSLIDQLGLDFDVINGRSGTQYVDFLRDPDELAQYDIIFFNCGMGDGWFPYADEVSDNLKDYVRDGGSIYASDWAYWVVESAWPAQNDFHGAENNPNTALVGAAQRVDADVLDPTMAAALGSDVAEINYDLDAWAAMEDSSAEILIEASYKWWDNFGQKTQSGPLATRIYDGDGMVLYTTFHNEQQTTGDMLVLLDEIILSL